MFRVAKIGVALFGAAALGALVWADPPKKEEKPKDQQVVKSEATPQVPAASVKFRKELNLPFASLNTLGARIDAARRAPDPVALAHAASELATAEKVSGKTASITSKQLIQEAAELASLRKQEAELQAVLHVSNQVALAEGNIANLKDSIALAKERTKDDKAALDRNEEPTSAPRKVVVNNYSTQYMDIYVNGYLKTQVAPGSSAVIMVEHRWNPTVLKAYGSEDMNNWGPRYIWGEFDKYTWNIY
jgi:hypothetical protein